MGSRGDRFSASATSTAAAQQGEHAQATQQRGRGFGHGGVVQIDAVGSLKQREGCVRTRTGQRLAAAIHEAAVREFQVCKSAGGSGDVENFPTRVACDVAVPETVRPIDTTSGESEFQGQGRGASKVEIFSDIDAVVARAAPGEGVVDEFPDD